MSLVAELTDLRLTANGLTIMFARPVHKSPKTQAWMH